MKVIMKNFRESGLWAGIGRRRHLSNPRRNALPIAEYLESRLLLSGGVTDATAIPAPLWQPTDTNLFDAQNGPMAYLGTNLVSIYQSYATGTAASRLASQFPTVEFHDGLVGMDIKSLGGNFGQFDSTLTNLGMQVTASSADYGIVEGWVPVAELPTIARLPQTMSGSPIEVPILSSFQGYQGIAYNESETSLNADAARSQFGLTGAGVTIGVLSDSVNQVNGGLQASYNTGDLSASNPVKVIQDGPPGAKDEGRAMLENIYDIAPGANLQFATGDSGELGFQQNIKALASAGSKVIVDDINYLDEPMFQDGLIAQGVDSVTAQGATYFSAAGNNGPDSGYLSTFRSDTTTVNGISGTWQNFNPGGGSANPLLPITTSINNAEITFEYDQPYGAQEPAGATAHVTSNVDFYVFNSFGAVIASGTNNNVAINAPIQQVIIPRAGSYTVGIVVVSGTNPGHVEFEGMNRTNAALSVSQIYGNTGGTYYPSTIGHQAAAATIGVAATPWWAPAPFLGQNPLTNEPFSSAGPEYVDLSPKGTPINPQVVQNPAITAPDGGTTSFFKTGPIDTSNPPLPGELASSSNLVPANQQSLLSFFGTSSAAPNAAAVAALMLQANPSLSRAQILGALTKTALPMNSTLGGTWNTQSGYGLVNAVAAIKSIAPPAGASASIAVSPSVSSPASGQPVTLTVTVTGSSGTPTGSVDFYDTTTNTDLGTVTLSGGQASLMTTPTANGSHVYLETYSGDTTYSKNTAYLLLIVGPNLLTLANFNGTNGASPGAGVIMDSSGNLYGTTESGGAYGAGTVYEVAHGTTTITTLASFDGANGQLPTAGVIMDSSGNLYGTTLFGGTNNSGTVFELAHASGTITTLASFSVAPGTGPLAGVIMDSSGNLYGTTSGSPTASGKIFELAHGSSTITTLASINFTGPGGVIMDSSGNLYGTTIEGGDANVGTIFELAHGSGRVTTLASFNGTTDAYPWGGVIMDSKGNLYGTTYGAYLNSTVFELPRGSNTITDLATFNGTDGDGSFANLIMDSSGNLYGTTDYGGTNNNGTVFELVHGSGTITTLVLFNGRNGANPNYGGVIMDSSGNLYGTTESGGAYGDGTVFEVRGLAAENHVGVVLGPGFIPANEEFLALGESQVVNDVAVSIAALAASESNAGVKKHAT